MISIDVQQFSGGNALPIIEGGKGISQSTGETCGAWAATGAIGTFSAVNADSYDEKGNVVSQIYHSKSRLERHREMIEYAVAGGIAQAKIARERSNGKGRIHMNVLWEMGACEEILTRILEGAKGCIHGVVCGAGLPYNLGNITSKFNVYYYPIVSSARAFSALYRRSFSKAKEFLGGVVYEDPWLAGGHNGLSNAEDPNLPTNPYLRLVELRKTLNNFNLSELPIIIAGGVWWLSEWADYIGNSELGNVAFQFGTRPLLTVESPVAKVLQPILMSLKEGDVKLTRLSPTGFYSSAVNNKMISELLAMQERQVPIDSNSAFKIKTLAGDVGVSSSYKEQIDFWFKSGFTNVLKTPDDTLIFITEAQAKKIMQDQRECCGCLSACRFSSWSQHDGSTGRLPDPRSFCIQKSLQAIAHGGNTDDNLIFAGHMAYRFAQDPFYDNNFIPTVEELVRRIMTGY